MSNCVACCINKGCSGLSKGGLQAGQGSKEDQNVVLLDTDCFLACLIGDSVQALQGPKATPAHCKDWMRQGAADAIRRHN